jgi:hypothetical protein
VNAKGGDGSFGCTALNLNDQLEITQPAGASFVLSKLAICVGRRNTVVAGQWVTIKKVKRYGLYVAGKQVTSLNEENVLGNGTVSYDSETETLTLMNADIAAGAEYGILATDPDVNIRLEGLNSVSSDQDALHAINANISGTGALYVNSVNGYGMRSTGSLIITGGAQVKAESTNSHGICTLFMTVSGAETTLSMRGALGAYAGYAPTLEDDLQIIQPAGAHYNAETGFIENADGEALANEWVTIGLPISNEAYDLFVAGIQVTEQNQDDVLGDGTVTYYPKSNTLELNGANIDEEGNGIKTEMPLTIELEGENTVKGNIAINISVGAAPSPKAAAIPEVRITGPGSLHAIGTETSIRSTVNLFISRGAQLTVEGINGYAIRGEGDVTIAEANTTVMLKGLYGPLTCNSFSLEKGLILGDPAGAYFNKETKHIVKADGEAVTDQWVTICSQDYIDGIENLTPARSEGKDLLYNLAGQKVGKDYKGIVIMNGRKVLKM